MILVVPIEAREYILRFQIEKMFNLLEGGQSGQDSDFFLEILNRLDDFLSILAHQIFHVLHVHYSFDLRMNRHIFRFITWIDLQSPIHESCLYLIGVFNTE